MRHADDDVRVVSDKDNSSDSLSMIVGILLVLVILGGLYFIFSREATEDADNDFSFDVELDSPAPGADQE